MVSNWFSFGFTTLNCREKKDRGPSDLMSETDNIMKTPANMSLTFFNFRPTVLNCGVKKLQVRLATVDLGHLPMVQVADHVMYVYFNQNNSPGPAIDDSKHFD